ncbi:hypothetical protein [Domibacillus robiginosus]|uniref:hypothetical protein n=1 Tax=Domibacillus robiginosus TaxID=1071054 RepID=UPI00067B3709|nr:hypothetical protein [Domibacillus robiginosus]
MEEAYLHGDIFHIEKKRREVEPLFKNCHDVKKWFNDRYRVFSEKSAFTCLCCSSPVNMNLTEVEGRPFYFKHIDGGECSYSGNARTYQDHVSKYESRPVKDIGLTVFREILEGQLENSVLSLKNLPLNKVNFRN